jgi:hypothetical protein
MIASMFVVIDEGQNSDLKVALAWAPRPARRASGLALEFLDFFLQGGKPIVKLAAFHPNARLASLAHEVNFGMLLEFADQQRVQMAAPGALQIDRFVFKHRRNPQASPSAY